MPRHRYLPRIAYVAAVISLIAALSSARAESAASVMTEFGLVGTWSPDCSVPPGKGVRTTFAVPTDGRPTRHTIAAGDRSHLGATTDAEIIAAERTAQDRLRLIQTLTKVVSITGAPINDYPKGNFETLIERAGDGDLSIATSGYSRWRHPTALVYERCAAVN
jgi:hypothetical protein